MFKRSRALASVALVAVTAGLAAPAWAETLQEAIALAYRTNPTLQGQRAQQRALDEAVPQARAGLRPTLSVSASTSYRNTSSPVPGVDFNGDGIDEIPPSRETTESDSVGATIAVDQTLYSGGRLARGIDAAEASVRSGREGLRSIEQQVLAAVIQAYVDVQRDVEILRIREANLAVLRRQLDESNARFEVGEITRTDVSQSEARLALSEADLAGAQAQLSVSRATYAAIVGQAPTNLEEPPALPGVPADFDTALDIGLAENPNLMAAEYDLQAAEARHAQARSAYLPSVGLSSSYGAATSVSGFDLSDRTNTFQAGVSLSVPLFTGGLNSSRVAQALEQANAAKIEIDRQKRSVLQGVSSAFAQVVSNRSQLEAGVAGVSAARIAAEGVRQEQQVGLRTTLDVLNGELELRNAEINLAVAKRNLYVAQASLLSSMGRLSGEDLAPGIEVYDAAANAERVRNRGALPWDSLIETLDRVAAPPVTPANETENAPIDTQLDGQIVRTAPPAQ
ncbi:TolC family outer membrane protein [Brevundimonas sp. NIBR11]|uniref:TolC family outer membrane protein n=1 Tax=Brevundimonas sp. NIBR11 TaxID=3015999 RepID=UPI0022F115F7|nr:TolC family outer membrane protein [Brevundimonas sp. NIBR11]WGM31226.1 Outer membrane efflux protein BepC [Brevundimonas sp. NIBR11]